MSTQGIPLWVESECGGVYGVGRGMEACHRGSFTVGAFLDACSRSQRLSASSGGRGRGSLSLMEGEAAEMFGRLRITPVASKETENKYKYP